MPLSTTSLGDFLPNLGDYHNSLRSVESSKNIEPLADYVRRVRHEKRLSTTDVENQSGGAISDAYVTRIENGYVKNVSPEKLAALAKGLGISEDEIFAVARGKSLDYKDPLDEVKVLFNGWAEASDEDRAATMELIRMIAEGFQKKRQRTTKSKTTKINGKK